MSDAVETASQSSPKKTGGPKSKKALLVGLGCIGVVAAVVALNSNALAIGPGASASTSNQAPVILSVTPGTERLQPLDQCQLTCDAADADGDTLTYTWTVTQGDITGDGPAVAWAAPNQEGLFRVSVSVDDGNGGVTESSLSLRVQYNNPPEFQSVSSFVAGVRPGASVPFSCSAVDPDGDEVTYVWRANFGEVQGDGDSVVWLAPERVGSYVVTVSARDAYGGRTDQDILINVTPSPTPKIGDFVVEPIMHNMLRFDGVVWDTYLGRSSSIQCVVLEGDEPLTYVWTADGGTLTADGATAIWQAPQQGGPATITVAVTDGHGDTNSAHLQMFVEDCTCKFE